MSTTGRSDGRYGNVVEAVEQTDDDHMTPDMVSSTLLVLDTCLYRLLLK